MHGREYVKDFVINVRIISPVIKNFNN